MVTVPHERVAGCEMVAIRRKFAAFGLRPAVRAGPDPTLLPASRTKAPRVTVLRVRRRRPQPGEQLVPRPRRHSRPGRGHRRRAAGPLTRRLTIALEETRQSLACPKTPQPDAQSPRQAAMQ